MKKTLLFFLLTLLTMSAMAENQTLSYTANGKQHKVQIMDNDQIFVFVYGGAHSSEPCFVLDGKKQIFNFKNSLLQMKEVYAKCKADPNMGTGDNLGQAVPVKFSPFTILWVSSNGTQYQSQNSGKRMMTTYAVTTKGNELVYEIKYSGMVSDQNDPSVRQKCFLTFVSESEIQSLIDILPTIDVNEIPANQPKNNVTTLSGHNKFAEEVERRARAGEGVK